MADASWAHGSGRDDSWGPSTPVRSSSAAPAQSAAAPAQSAAASASSTAAPSRSSRLDHAPQRAARTPRAGGRGDGQRSDEGWQSGPARGRSTPSAADRVASTGGATHERGLRAWAALLLLVGILVLGILIDTLRSEQLSTGFDLGIILGSVAAIIAVRRSGMFWVVVSPPIVYSLGAGISLYVRSGGLHDRGVLIDAATNWLVYGFPAIAAASAAVLIIAGIRLITRK